MAIVIEWTANAEHQLKDIFDYHVQAAGIKTAKKIIRHIIKRVDILFTNPFSGPKEELLVHYKQDFRYLVEGNYKIIYFVEMDLIIVVMVFDCRQNPVKMEENVK